MIENLNQLIERAKQKSPKNIAIAAAEDQFVMQAIAKAKELGLIAPIFIGNKELILNMAKSQGIVIDEHEIRNQPDTVLACEQAVKIVSTGEADILMKGLITTKDFLKQVVRKEFDLMESSLISHLAVFESPHYPKCFGLSDAAMNISPKIEEKIAIIDNSVKVLHSIGISKPKVAILAAVEKVNPKITATTDAVKIKEITRGGATLNCILDGPFGLDNAISLKAALHKNISSDVAGDADLLFVPDLNSGNILYKSLIYFGKARCAAILTGTKAPIVLTSRSDSEETKFLSIVLGVLTSK